MDRPHWRSPRTGWVRTLAFTGLALLVASGCKDREKKIYIPTPSVAGPAEFGDPGALDLPPFSPSGTVQFDAQKHVAVSRNGDALIVYTADNGTGTLRLNVVRYDHSRNPIVRYFVSPQTFDANSGNVIDAKILADGQGDGLLVWIQVFNALPRLFASAYHGSSSSFSPPRMIDAGGENMTPEGVAGFDAALDDAGNAVIGFYENPASPGVCEAFGVHYDKSEGSYSSPKKVSLPSYSSPGHLVEGILSLAGPPGQGYLLIKQDSDPGPGSVIHFSVSR